MAKEPLARHGFGYPPTGEELAVLVPLAAVAVSIVCLLFGACLPTFHVGSPGLQQSVYALALPVTVSWAGTPMFWYAIPIWLGCLSLSYRSDMHVLGLSAALAALYTLATGAGLTELAFDYSQNPGVVDAVGAGFWFWFVGVLTLVVSNSITLYLALIDPDDRVQFLAKRTYIDQTPTDRPEKEPEYDLANPGGAIAPRLAQAFASLATHWSGSVAKGAGSPAQGGDSNGRRSEKPHPSVRAVYEEGVFRPLTSVDLPEYCTVQFVPRVVS